MYSASVYLNERNAILTNYVCLTKKIIINILKTASIINLMFGWVLESQKVDIACCCAIH